MGRFSMVGRLSIPKASDKFQPYTMVESSRGTGWVSKRLSFNCSAADSRHMLNINAGCFKDGHGYVYTFTAATFDSSGNRIKDGESIQIPFNDRLTSPEIKNVADFRKFVVDLESHEVRNITTSVKGKLERKESLTKEELDILDIEKQEDVGARLELREKRRKEFISEWDFIDFVKKLIESGKYENRKFYISGRREYRYSVENGRIYESLVPNRILLEDNDTEEYARESFDILYGKNSLDTLDEESSGKIHVNGWEMTYERNLKKNIFVERSIVILSRDDEEKKKANVLKKRFTPSGDTLEQRSIEVELIDGSPAIDITDDMLTDEQKEDIEFGLITREELIRELGGSVRGDRVRELRYLKFRGRSGAEETTYFEEDMKITLDDDDDLFPEDEMASKDSVKTTVDDDDIL